MVTLSEFLIDYAEVNTIITIRMDVITYSNLSVIELLKEMEKYKEIMGKEISLIGVENNTMVIYL